MPTVQGKITLPDLTKRDLASVQFDLVDQFGQTLPRAWVSATDQTIVRQMPVPLDTTGAYTIVLTDNASINPANSRWRRRITYQQDVVDDYLVVPTGGGPYQEEDIAQGVSALPTPSPSNEIASFVLGVDSSNLAVTGFTIVAVPNFLVTVPDLSTPCLLFGQMTVKHTTTASALLFAGMALQGETNIANAKAYGHHIGGTAGTPVSIPFHGRLPAHSAGTYQGVVNGSTGNVVAVSGPSVSIVEAIRI